MYMEMNPNPFGLREDDCAVRAFVLATGSDWDSVYLALAVKGLEMKRMPNNQQVYRAFLRDHGFRRTEIPDTCPDCYTVRDFCKDHPQGTYVLGTYAQGQTGHVVAVIDGNYCDFWDSGDEVPVTIWEKAEEEQHV